jgi:hypothetical protein
MKIGQATQQFGWISRQNEGAEIHPHPSPECDLKEQEERHDIGTQLRPGVCHEPFNSPPFCGDYGHRQRETRQAHGPSWCPPQTKPCPAKPAPTTKVCSFLMSLSAHGITTGAGAATARSAITVQCGIRKMNGTGNIIASYCGSSGQRLKSNHRSPFDSDRSSDLRSGQAFDSSPRRLARHDIFIGARREKFVLSHASESRRGAPVVRAWVKRAG